MSDVINLSRERNRRKGPVTDTDREAAGEVRTDEMSLDKILDRVDGTYGRNAAIREYVLALRDLQVANNNDSYVDTSLSRDTAEPYSRVCVALSKLIAAEIGLARELYSEPELRDAIGDALSCVRPIPPEDHPDSRVTR